MVQLTTRGVAFRLRQLLDEFHLLIGSFPDLRDAFDADELPLAFILRRDSRLTSPRGTIEDVLRTRQQFGSPANNVIPHTQSRRS